MAEMKAGYKQTDVGLIPEDWDVASLGKLFEITSSKRVFQNEWRKSGVPFYRARELAVLGEKGRVDNDLFIDHNLYEKHKRSYGVSQVGDVLVTGVGTLGKVYVVPDEKAFYFKDGNIIWFKVKGKLNSNFLKQLYYTPLIKYQISESSAGSTVGTYTITGAKKTLIPLPKPEEQKQIAAALSDVDGLIEALSQLIAKKRDMKIAAMQQLLTGKKRLPGFDGEWEEKALSSIVASFTTGKLDANAMTPKGQYRFYTCAKDFYMIDQYAYDDEALLISGNGANVGYIHYYKGKFNAYQRTYVLTGFDADVFFLQHYMSKNLKERIRVELNAGNTPYITMGTLTDMIVKIPSTTEEQTAIAAILSDMDTEIDSLEQRLEKARSLKTGMMQELLTGKTRLIKTNKKQEAA